LALLVLSYFVDEYFTYRHVPLVGTVLDNLIIGLFGGVLTFVWATLTSEKESAIRRVEEGKHDAVVEERNRLAREIHDTCAQGFTGIALQLEAAEEMLLRNSAGVLEHIISARTLARESLKGVRESVWKMRPNALEGITLPEAIEGLARKVLSGTSIEVNVALIGTAQELASEIEANLLHISQEAITNAIKHSEASEIRVELAYEPGQIQLCVKDDGRGFVPNLPWPQRGFGLTSMRERAKSLGGEWSICSAPGQGTQIQVVVPVPPQAAQGEKYATG
jgi:signal transduction histidine kinase